LNGVETFFKEAPDYRRKLIKNKINFKKVSKKNASTGD
jgi:hypothetical protein